MKDAQVDNVTTRNATLLVVNMQVDVVVVNMQVIETSRR